MNISETLAHAEAHFDHLPLLVEGESKVLRDAGGGLAAVRLKPTLYSITHNRCGVVAGTDTIRLKSSRALWNLLESNGVNTTIAVTGEVCYITEYITPPPIEVIVKSCQIGTPKHIYKGMSNIVTRFGGTILEDMMHPPYVRFDWRNPLPNRDECLPVWLADQFINVSAAEQTALSAFRILSKHFSRRDLLLLDICLMLTADGTRIFGEISPDCMRVKFLGCDYDKDLWRKGKEPSEILEKWKDLLRLIEF